MADWILLGIALAAGFVLGILVILPLRLRKKAKPAPPLQEEVVPLEIVSDDPPPPPEPAPRMFRPPPSSPAQAAAPADWEADHFSIAARPSVPQPPPKEAGGIPTEWARRVVGPLEPGRVKGICSGCGTKLSVGAQRPLRIACPVCGRTRLLP